MRMLRIALPAALAIAVSACAGTEPKTLAAGALPADGPVSVRWQDPMQFSEVRFSADRWEATRSDWLQPLAQYLRDQAQSRLEPGQQLAVTILDLDRAGGYEPWLGPDYHRTRMVRDIYPPRMTVQFELRNADGSVASSGERKLSDPGFLTGASPIQSTDVLRFEKRMIDSWLSREFGPRSAAR